MYKRQTQGILFGFLGNAFLAFLYHAVPRLAKRPVLNRKLGWWLFAVWNFCVVVPGWILVFAGFGQPLEWAEFPLIVAAFVVAGFVLAIVQFVTPFLRKGFSGSVSYTHLRCIGWCAFRRSVN